MGCLHQVDIKRHSLTARIIAPFCEGGAVFRGRRYGSTFDEICRYIDKSKNMQDDMGEGIVKKSEKNAYIFYGWSLSLCGRQLSSKSASVVMGPLGITILQSLHTAFEGYKMSNIVLWL